jgi:DNA (cytosine-5)-methyltransferase 1
MLRDKRLTYVTLFGSVGADCHDFQMEGYHCIATNELVKRRMQV